MIGEYQLDQAKTSLKLARYLLVEADKRGLTHGEKHHYLFVVISLIGDAQNSLQDGGHDTALVKLLADRHGYASRIDLTIDIHEGQLTPRKVYSALKKGALHVRADTYRFIEGKKGDVQGDTLYIGAPKSDRQFRCYNKAAELGIVNGTAWLRLELELRRLRSNAAFQSAAHNGVPATVNGHFGDFIDFQHPEYVQAIAGEGVPPVDIPRRQSNRQRWLLGQVAQALAKEMREDVEFKPIFDAAVQDALDLLD